MPNPGDTHDMIRSIELAGADCDKRRVIQPCVGAVSVVMCACGKTYARCLLHGGETGCRRSIHSHRALYCKAKWS